MVNIQDPSGWSPDTVVVQLRAAGTIALGNVVYCQPNATYGLGIQTCATMSTTRARDVGAIFGVAQEAGVAGEFLSIMLRGSTLAKLDESFGVEIEVGTTLVPAVAFTGDQGLCSSEAVPIGTTIHPAAILGISMELVGATGTGDVTTSAMYSIIFDGINKFGNLEEINTVD